MKFPFLLLALLLALVAAGTFWAVKNAPSSEPAEAQTPPWAEVFKPSLFSKILEGEQQELKTGDEVKPGSSLQTGSTGRASIHFPDGSEARLEASSSLTVQESSFSEKEKTLKVKLSLAAGRAWSRVSQLANPASFWEIETPTAVATVRGTSFGVDFLNGVFSVLVLENSVLVRLGEIEAEVSAGEIVEILPEEIEDLKRGIKKLTPRKADRKTLEDEWVQFNHPSEEKPREPEPKKTPPASPDESQGGPPPQKTESSPKSSPKFLEITAAQRLDNVKENASISFQAFVIFSDNSKKEVTQEANWNVSNEVGRFTQPGIFLVEPSQKATESGFVTGQVVAIWQDSESGIKLLGQGPTITIQVLREETPPPPSEPPPPQEPPPQFLDQF